MDIDHNCISHWFPRLAETGVPVPLTAIVETEPGAVDWLSMFDGAPTTEAYQELSEGLRRAALDIGLPCFLRTGHGSGKHSWLDTCYVADIERLDWHICQLAEWCYCVDIRGLPTHVWAVRELLPTEPAFLAFQGMPMCRERRYFISGGEIVHHLPYWPSVAVAEGMESPQASQDAPDWPERLAALNREGPDEVAELTDLSRRVAAAFRNRAWSLDWLWTRRGWYAIDMAVAEDSWGCPEALKRKRDS